MRLQSRCQVGLQSSKGLTGTGGFAPKFTQVVVSPQFLSDYWSEASVPYQMGFSVGFLHTLISVTLYWKQVIKNNSKGRGISLYLNKGSSKNLWTSF